MEINKIANSPSVSTGKKAAASFSPSVSFAELTAKEQEKLRNERLRQLADEIEQQGKKLAESRAVDDLRRYKQLVRQLLDEAVNHGLKLTEQYGFHWSGRSRIYHIVKTIDQKLLGVANAVLEQERPRIDLLKTLGEIQGLIVNLYT
ncbi:YaaR family protein [Geobacillus kaustophilus]|uniref:YaaR family protein n=1 Tax=Geobacillus kaustophilus TaxID=1462 RepID=UPI0005CCCB1D|nr:YaaR family protein [Geobacillus kaustophilus]